MALNTRILVVTVHLFVLMSMFLGKGICDDICPNGITNKTGLTSGEIMYPSSGTYGVNETKCWRIEIPKPYSGIGVTYDYVETEECDGCQCDFFKFAASYNALSGKGSCGRFSPSYIEYTNLIRGPRPDQEGNGENFYLKLKSDDSVHHKGFRISFIAKSEDSGSKSFLNVSQGEISTPKFGTKNYPASFAWQWFILAPEGHQVKITFDSFELEQSENCKNDYLEVRKAYFKDLHDPRELQAVFGEILAKPMCGSTKPSTIQSAGNMVWVHFRSDSISNTTYKGFKASFTTSGQGRLPISNLLTVLFISALLMCAK